MLQQQTHKPARRRGSVADEARAAIDEAEEAGVGREAMTLRMTLRDVSELKRDPKVAVADISFAGGEMRYLGVMVEQGYVTVTTLDRGDTSFRRGAAAEAAAAPKVKPVKKRITKKMLAEAAAAAAAEAEAE